MAAMGAGDRIPVGEVQTYADRARRLARIEMHESRDSAAGELDMHALFESADRAHLAVRLDKVLTAQLHGFVLPSRSLSRDAARFGRRRGARPTAWDGEIGRAHV